MSASDPKRTSKTRPETAPDPNLETGVASWGRSMIRSHATEWTRLKRDLGPHSGNTGYFPNGTFLALSGTDALNWSSAASPPMLQRLKEARNSGFSGAFT
jgi:hypothetical protein